jgi:response regulator RpfG family c-di-GMP phosphodiesterase
MNFHLKQRSLGVYIVDSDVEKKLRLKQATTPVTLFKQTLLFNNLEEVIQKMQVDDGCDIIFISTRFPESDVASFVSRVKQSKSGQDSTFVMVLGAKESQSPKLPEYMLLGIDGFLFEPYSVDGLTETANLAIKIKRERKDAREKLAITVMVKDMIKQIDGIAITKKFGLGSSKLAARLESLSGSIRRLSEDSLGSYYHVLVDEMMKAPIPEKLAQMESYKGASSRVKKTLEKKIIDELESED